MQRNAGKPRNQPVGKPGGDLSRDEGIVPLLAPARDDVVPCIELLEEPGDVGRVVLTVAIDGYQDLAPRLVERRRERRGLAAVAPQADDSHVFRVAPPNRVEPFGRAIGRPVIYEDQLVPQRSRPQHDVELGMKWIDVVDFVEDGNQHRQIVGSRHIFYMPAGGSNALSRVGFAFSRENRPAPLFHPARY